MPDFNRTVLATANNDREARLEDGKGNVTRVPLECLHAALAEVVLVLDFDGPVVSCCDQIRLVSAGVVFNVVDALLVGIGSENRRM